MQTLVQFFKIHTLILLLEMQSVDVLMMLAIREYTAEHQHHMTTSKTLRFTPACVVLCHLYRQVEKRSKMKENECPFNRG